MTRFDLLEWLAKADESALGECDGPELQELVDEAFVRIEPIHGMHAKYSRVTVTEAGLRALKMKSAPMEMLRIFATQRHDATVLEIVARAYDREDSAQRGEADPWASASPDAQVEIRWREERLACALCALEALAGYWQGLAL